MPDENSVFLSKLFALTTRLCGEAEQRAGSACRAPRAETTISQET